MTWRVNPQQFLSPNKSAELTLVLKSKSEFWRQPWKDLLIPLFFFQTALDLVCAARESPSRLVRRPSFAAAERRLWVTCVSEPMGALILSSDTCRELWTGNSELGRQPESFRKRAKPLRNTNTLYRTLASKCFTILCLSPMWLCVRPRQGLPACPAQQGSHQPMGQGQDWGLIPSPSAASLPILLVTIATGESLEDLFSSFYLSAPGPFMICLFTCHRPWELSQALLSVSWKWETHWSPLGLVWWSDSGRQEGRKGCSQSLWLPPEGAEFMQERYTGLLPLFSFSFGPSYAPHSNSCSLQDTGSRFSQCSSKICSMHKPPILAFRFLRRPCSHCPLQEPLGLCPSGGPSTWEDAAQTCVCVCSVATTLPLPLLLLLNMTAPACAFTPSHCPPSHTSDLYHHSQKLTAPPAASWDDCFRHTPVSCLCDNNRQQEGPLVMCQTFF